MVYSKEQNTQSFSLSFVLCGGLAIQRVNSLAEALVNTDKKWFRLDVQSTSVPKTSSVTQIRIITELLPLKSGWGLAPSGYLKS